MLEQLNMMERGMWVNSITKYPFDGTQANFAIATEKDPSTICKSNGSFIVFKYLNRKDPVLFTKSNIERKHTHLYNISKVDRSLWNILGRELLFNSWTVKELNKIIKVIKKRKVPKCNLEEFINSCLNKIR